MIWALKRLIKPKSTLIVSSILLAACASEPNKSIALRIQTCNYATEARELDDLPIVSTETEESALFTGLVPISDYTDLQNWALSAVTTNKVNRKQRQFTSECIERVLLNYMKE